MKPTTTDIHAALRAIELSELDDEHPRKLAHVALKRYRRATAIDPNYDFNSAPRELRQTIYNQIVRYSARHSLLTRLLGR